MGRLVDPVPYREAADMPEVKIKKEWYCTLDGASRLTTPTALAAPLDSSATKTTRLASRRPAAR